MSYDATQNNIQGWMGEDELDWLYQQAEQMLSIVEIGSWKGRSAHALLSGCPGIVICIDHFKGNPEEQETCHAEAKTVDIHEQFMQNVGHFGGLVVKKCGNEDVVDEFEDGEIDMVFIDGSHTYDNAKADIQRWLPKCRKLLCGHDYHQAFIPRIAEELNLPIQEIGIGSIWKMEIPCDPS